MRCSKWLVLKEKCTQTKTDPKENREAVEKFVQHCRTCYICQDHYNSLVEWFRETKKEDDKQ
jgi:hypothetical protein